MVAAPQIDVRVERQQWVDTLRVLLIAGVIVVHTATGYVTDFAGWYYDDEVQPDAVISVLIAGPALLGGIYGLGPLFLVAGWFSVGSLRRRGPAAFAGSRLVRLGIPLLVYLALVNPAADYVGNLRGPHDSFAAYLAITEFSVMWFVAALLACSLGYAVLRALRAAPRERKPPSPRAWVAAAVVISFGSLLVWQVYSLVDTGLMNARFGAWVQAAVLFALGVMAAEAGPSTGAPWERSLMTGTGVCDRSDRARRAGTVTSDRNRRPRAPASSGAVGRSAERRAGVVVLIGSIATLGVVAWIGPSGDLDAALSGLTWTSVTFAALYGVVSVGFTLWCVSWISRRWPTHGRVIELAGRGSYATYVTHPLWLTLLMLAFSPVALLPVLKFFVVAALAIPVCFVIGYGITRLPLLSRVF